ncbi:DUF2059 domain-containing protein [Rhodobacteraceae bacterium LMO-12]|nr:DUF2059 domain-containing protein [Rhodobacteraceae bacterium LMO-JJ12]
MAQGYQARGWLLLVATLLIGVMAQAGQAADRERLKAFLGITGFDVALDSIALSAENAPLMLGMQADDFGYQWTRTTKQVFDSDRMQAMALDLLEKTLSDELLTHAASFYATPLGLRLVEVENSSHMMEDDTLKKAQGEALIAKMRSEDPERLELIRKMNDAIDSAGLGVRAVQEIQLRFIMAANAAGVLTLKIDEEGLRARLRENEDELRQSLAASALTNAAYTYRDFTNDEIETYAEALIDPRMNTVYDLMNAIQWEIMANRFEALAVKMADMSPGEEL